MAMVVQAIFYVLFVNAVLAFFVALFWQARVLYVIFRDADSRDMSVPWKALANQNSPTHLFGRFFAGELYPDLRPKWAKAVTYVAYSYIALFVFSAFR